MGTILSFILQAFVGILVVFAVVAGIRGKRTRTPKKKYYRFFDDGIVIEYDVEPPNFKKTDSEWCYCGVCTFQGRTEDYQAVCEKYDVRYYGIGCVRVTICGDFDWNL